MGGICSTDVTPDAPKVIKADPDANPVAVQVAAFGMFGGSRDFGIWLNQRPAGSSEQNETVWLWFNKSTLPGGHVRVDLENFMRGHNADFPKKGRVLYYAQMAERPNFQHFQRVAGSGRDAFFGFFGSNSYQDPDDMFYINHPQHRPKVGREAGSQVLGHVIAKWQMNTKAQFHDGDMARATNALQGQPVELEIFSKGTVICTYQQYPVQVADHDSEGKVIGHHTEIRHASDTTEFVDRIEYRLMFQGQLWTMFFVNGNTFDTDGQVDPTIDSILFTTRVGGGWFKRSTFTTTTKAGVDPALAMLISHVVATEYSVAQVKTDLHINLPERFPGGMGLLGNGLQGMHMQYPFSQPTGNFQWR